MIVTKCTSSTPLLLTCHSFTVPEFSALALITCSFPSSSRFFILSSQLWDCCLGFPSFVLRLFCSLNYSLLPLSHCSLLRTLRLILAVLSLAPATEEGEMMMMRALLCWDLKFAWKENCFPSRLTAQPLCLYNSYFGFQGDLLAFLVTES